MTSQYSAKPHRKRSSRLDSANLAGLADELMLSCTTYQRALLRILAVGHRHQLEMHSLVWGVACEAPSSHAFILVHVAGKLQENEPWLSAIETTPGALPGSVVLALRTADDNGSLDGLLAELESCHRHQEFLFPSDLSPGANLFGAGMRVFAAVWTLNFLMLWILPQFQEFTEELGIELPNSMLLLMDVTTAIVYWWFLPIFILLVLVPFWLPIAIRYFRRWNPLTWRQPHLDADVNRRLALASVSDAGLPVIDRVKMMLGNASSKRDKRRLKSAIEKIEANKGQWRALSSANIISRREANAFSESSSGEAQGWLLRWSADKRQNQKTIRGALALRMLIGAINLVVAVLCALVCIAVFSTMIQLMEAVQ